MHESNPGWLSLNGYNADKRTWTVVITLQKESMKTFSNINFN